MAIKCKVVGQTPNNREIMLCPEAPEIGSAVTDEKKNRVGYVSKVFGPVDSPYASVTLDKNTAITTSTLYVNKGSQNGKTKRTN